MKTVYFVRHGESEVNLNPAHFHGPESPLTKKGVEQAKLVADRATRLEFDTLITSSVRRAQETANIIGGRTGHQPEASDLFVERVTPRELIGQPREDPSAKAMFESWVGTLFEHEGRVGSGENFADLKERAAAALRFLEERPEASLLVVTHGFFLRTLLAYIMFGDALRPEELFRFLKSTRTTNTGLTVLAHAGLPGFSGDSHEARWFIKVFNDHAHLG